MGYDLFWTDPPDNKAAHNAARDQFDAACKTRDKYERDSVLHAAAQVQVERAYEAMDAAQPEYFRLNIWGMSDCRSHMSDFGMLCEPEPHTRDDWDEVNRRAAAAPEEDSEEIYREILSDHRGECPGIPWWKLSDNSGWYVLPGEIRAALHSYLTKRNAGQEPPDAPYWADWIQWLKDAAEHGGFRVF